jgi:hypothetical protein
MRASPSSGARRHRSAPDSCSSLPRVGKNAALNAAAAAATGEVLVLSDADSHLAPDAIRRLVAPLADPDDRRRRQAISAMRAREARRARLLELRPALEAARVPRGSITSATGQIYAIRADLFEPVPDGVTDDFFVSTGAVAAGSGCGSRRTRSRPVRSRLGAHRVPAQGARERARLASVWARRALLDPRRHGFYRAPALHAQGAAPARSGFRSRSRSVASIALASVDPFYAGRGRAQMFVHGSALAGWSLRGRERSARVSRCRSTRSRARGGRDRPARRRPRPAPSVWEPQRCAPRAGARRSLMHPGRPARARLHGRRRARCALRPDWVAPYFAAVLYADIPDRCAPQYGLPSFFMFLAPALIALAIARRTVFLERSGVGWRRALWWLLAWGAVIVTSFLYATDRTRSAATLFDYLDAIFIVLIMTLFLRRREQLAPCRGR